MSRPNRIGQVWEMMFSSDSRCSGVIYLVVGWDEENKAHQVIDLANGYQFRVGERLFEGEPWWREIK